MGKSKETTNTQESRTADPTQQAFANEALSDARFFRPFIRSTGQAGLNVAEQIFRGGELPGFLSGLGEGINEEQTQALTSEALRDITPGFASTGLLDSGVRASISARTAGDIRRNVAETNLNRQLNLLNLAFGGQAQITNPQLSAAASQAGSLSGFGTGSRFTTVKSPNPFLQSFQTSFGETLGSPKFSFGPASFGG